jgi:hypothetical protein
MAVLAVGADRHAAIAFILGDCLTELPIVASQHLFYARDWGHDTPLRGGAGGWRSEVLPDCGKLRH